MTDDLAELASRFGAALRLAGLPVGPGRCERFAAAVTLALPQTRRELYLCALATLVSSREHAELLELVFGQVFGGLDDPATPAARPAVPPQARGRTSPEDLLAQAARAARLHASQDRPRPEAAEDDSRQDRPETWPEVEARYLGSDLERLAAQDFAELSGPELMQLAALMRRITLAVPVRRSRRQQRRPGGPRTDMRSTLRQARRTGGDVFRLISRAPARRPRKLVVLCDISGSMEPYARAMIQLLYCAAGGARAEVFSFATRLTRLTPALSRSLPGPALRLAGQAAPDWLGGTRIGASLKEFNDSYGRRGVARGAVVVIISDGWDTGDPALVSREMGRLSLVAHRIVWVNPRTKSDQYRPLAGGMAAAWPHCDAVVSAHTVQALDQLIAALADPVRRRAAVGLSRLPGGLALALLVLDRDAAEHAGAGEVEHGGIRAAGLGALGGDVTAAEDRHAGVDHVHFRRDGDLHAAEDREGPDRDVAAGQGGVPQVDVGAAEDGDHHGGARYPPGALPDRAAEDGDDRPGLLRGDRHAGVLGRRGGVGGGRQVLDDRDEVGLGPGRVNQVEPVRMLVGGQPALG
jgi:uncharacterized protein with von Willebrand factor type A (vWA) domain